MPEIEKDYYEEITYRDALQLAMYDAMKESENVILMGEDVGAYGGAYGASKGLIDIFGDKRILDTPISEPAIIGSAIGAAMTGLRPIAELMYADFFGMSMDQIANQAAKIRYMFGGQINVPIVVRTQGGTGRSGGAQHSQSLESWIMYVPGLYLIMPCKPNDAYHLLREAINLNDPTVFIEHKLLYNSKGPLDKKKPDCKFGKALVRKSGKDVTIISYSRMVNFVEEASTKLAEFNINAEVIDLRTLNPLDKETIIKSVRKTKRALIVSEGHYTASVASEITALLFEHCYKEILKPVLRYTAEDTPIPVAPNLEKLSIPTVDGIINFVKKLCE